MKRIKMRLKLMVFSLFILTGAVLASCGGAGPEQVSVSMREFSFSPEQVSVPAGAEVTLVLRNLGALEHNFHIMDLGKEVADAWTDADEAGTLFSNGPISGGDVETVTFTAPSVPGEYQFLCSVPSHFELGMLGTFTVTGP